MYIICVESSRTRGMGHLFRSLLYASYLDKIKEQYIVLINNDKNSVDILDSKKIPFRIVNYDDLSDWQTPIIRELNVDVWIQDKFETSLEMAQNIKKNNILLCMIDEFGVAADLCDLHFAGMMYLTGYQVRGKKIFCGTDYVILNPEIDNYRRIRTNISNIIVSLGGSDPYGLTVEIVKEISKTNYNVGIVIGPDFSYKKELEMMNVNKYPILQNVPSLIQEFSKYDLAITSGGITCCEVNSCGIPSIIFANASHEIHTGHFMQEKGGALYAGSYKCWNKDIFKKISNLDIKRMSQAGIQTFDTKAIERIFSIIEKEKKDER